MGAVKHTPGPWYVTGGSPELLLIREEASDYSLAVADDGGHVDPQFALDDDVITANANLIAAAPDLYEALETVILGISQGSVGKPAVLAAVSALARARGEAA